MHRKHHLKFLTLDLALFNFLKYFLFFESEIKGKNNEHLEVTEIKFLSAVLSYFNLEIFIF